MALIGKGELENDAMNSWKQLSMSSAEQKPFGEQALVLKYGEDARKGLLPENVVSSRRYEDVEDNHWTVFNRTQENLTRGRMDAFFPTHDDGTFARNGQGRRVRHAIRSVNGIDQSTGLKQQLWDLATAFAALKKS